LRVHINDRRLTTFQRSIANLVQRKSNGAASIHWKWAARLIQASDRLILQATHAPEARAVAGAAIKGSATAAVTLARGSLPSPEGREKGSEDAGFFAAATRE
jgi:hypothetical protein